jgi:hypothetical protein
MTREMLNADGAFFVFALATQNPWKLKWASVPPRFATYFFTVIPTELVERTWRLSGEQIASVNAIFFYGLPLVQFFVVVALAWRRFPHLLIFPVMQYAFSLALGFGFPSEMLIAPGFFWICLFLLLSRQFSISWFAISFAGLVFSHEMALLGAALVVCWAWYQWRSGDKQYGGVLLVCGLVLCAWIGVRLEFQSQADVAIFTALNPRRVGNNPTLWLIFAAVVSIALWSTKPSPRLRHFWIALPCVLLPLALHPWINFGQGRYDARTLIGLGFPLFGMALIIANLRSSAREVLVGNQLRLASTVAPMITAALALNLGAGLAFLLDWNIARTALQGYVGHGQFDVPIKAVTLSEARESFTPREVEAIERTGFEWSWPYRAVVLAENYRPERIIYDPNKTVCDDRLVALNQGSVPFTTRAELTELLCVPHPPQPPTFSQRIVELLRQLGDTILRR